MKKILILIAMLCMSIGSASASDFDYHLSNVPHPMQADVWTVDWNTLKIASPSEIDNIVIEHLSPKPEQVATVDCYTETEDGQRQIIQKMAYLYTPGQGVEFQWEWANFYAETECELHINEENLTPSYLHLPGFMSYPYDTQQEGSVSHGMGISKNYPNKAWHYSLKDKQGNVHELLIASITLLDNKTDKDVSVRAYKDPDLDRYDGGFAFNVEFTNNTNKPLHKYYALLSYQSKLWNFQNQNWALSEIHFFDAEIPANGVFETGISTGAFITQNNIIWIEFDSKNEMEQMKNSYPRQQTNNGYLSDYERDIDSGEVGQKWLKDTFGIEFTK